jgi:hypothetical protein
MANIFISYVREDLSQVLLLVDHLTQAGHQAWMDRQLTGGQSWWNELMRRIRECDVFLPVLSERFSNSVPCRRELAYALSLHRPLLPVQVQDSVEPALLPPQLSETQWVNYRTPSVESAIYLMRSLQALPSAPALPDPLPPQPEVPITYLDHLLEKIDSPDTLDRGEQIQLLADLKDHVGGDEEESALRLLRRLRQRHDLLYSTAAEIDRVLAASSSSASSNSPPVTRMDADTAKPPRPKNYVGWAWASFLLCGWLVAIPALVNGNQVNTRYELGDYAGAVKASSKARMWLIIAFVAGALFWLVAILA